MSTLAPMLAEVVQWKQLGQTLLAALVAGTLVTMTFSLAIYGTTRAADLRRAGRNAEATFSAAVGVLALIVSVAAVAFGLVGDALVGSVPMLITLRNILIIALLALLLTILPGGGNLVNALFTALSLIFLAAIGMLGVRMWRETSLTRDAMTEQQRMLFYGSLGAIALMIAGLDELWDTGPGAIVWLAIVGTSGWLLFSTWRAANSY